MTHSPTPDLDDHNLCPCQYLEDKSESTTFGCRDVCKLCVGCVRCGGCDPAEVDQCLASLADRCVFPACGGGGYLRLRLSVAVPLVAVPGGLLLASVSAWLTVAVFTMYAVGLWVCYRVWKKRRRRTQVFYTWAVTSCLFIYYMFQVMIVALRELFFWENATISILFASMMYTLHLVRRGPGTVTKLSNTAGQYGNNHKVPHIANGLKPEMNGEMNGYTRQREYTEVHLDSEGSDGDSLCAECQIVKPPRAAHCSVCGLCVPGQDHHCVWVDTCIGSANHRLFLLGIVLFILTGCYGSHLMLTTVCTPEIYYDWFLLPVDCQFVYNSIFTSLGYVCAVYTILATGGMAAILLYQVALISQNVSPRELRAGPRRCGLYLAGNTHSRGPWRNWRAFLTGRRWRTQYRTGEGVDT